MKITKSSVLFLLLSLLLLCSNLPANDFILTFEDNSDISNWDHWDEPNVWTTKTWDSIGGVGGSGALLLGDGGFGFLAKRPINATPGTYYSLSVDIKTSGWNNPGTYNLYLFVVGIADTDSVLINSEGTFTTFTLEGITTNDSGYIRIYGQNMLNHNDVWVDNVVFDDDTTSFSTSLENETNRQPNKINLSQNYPNPFNPSTIIHYTLSKTDDVKIDVFNMLGQKIETLLNKQMPIGSHKVEFNAKDLPGGIYFYRIITGKYQITKKMILLR